MSRGAARDDPLFPQALQRVGHCAGETLTTLAMWILLMGCFSWLGIKSSRATRTKWRGWSRRQPLSGVLLSLPLIYALLSLFPLCWPRVLKVWAYPHLARGVHHLYRLALATLFSAGLSSQASIGGLLMMGSCVKMANGAWVRGEIEEDGTWRLELAGCDISQIPIPRILRGQLLG